MFTFMLVMVLVCIILEILIVSYLTSPYNLPCFSTLHLCLQKLEKGVMRSTVSSRVQQQQGELATTSFKVRFSPTLHQYSFSSSRYRRTWTCFFIVLLITFFWGKRFSYCCDHSLHVATKGCNFFQTLIVG
jgi:hypothetical protein